MCLIDFGCAPLYRNSPSEKIAQKRLLMCQTQTIVLKLKEWTTSQGLSPLLNILYGLHCWFKLSGATLGYE